MLSECQLNNKYSKYGHLLHIAIANVSTNNN